MITVPQKLRPAWLLTEEALSERSRKILARARDRIEAQRWNEAERHVLSVRDASQKLVETMLDYATALIYLADIYRMVGRLGPALEHNELAQQMFKNQPGPAHYHNRAVADYALGLIHHVLGNDSKALHWYEHAHDLFERASLHWGVESNLVCQEQCSRVMQWMDALSDSITAQGESLLPERPFFDLVWFPVYSKGKKAYSLARFTITNRGVKTDEVQIDGQTYTLGLPDGRSIRRGWGLDFDVPHIAVQVEENGQPGESAYALMQGSAPNEFGRFVRQPDGSISFESDGSGPHVLGGGAVAVLRLKT